LAIYQLKTFARFARGEKIAAKGLIEAIERAERGLVDADLGESNIDDRQLAVLRRIANGWLSANAAAIKKAVELGELIEVTP
jgi:hypothetical protein